MRFSYWRTATCLVVLALGTACSSSGDNAPKEAPTGDPIVWTVSDRHWVSHPEASGGRFVAYLERDGRLFVAGVDRSGGEPVWELPASASSLTQGVALRLAHDAGHVYFATPVDVGGTGAAVFVVAVDAFRGTEVWRTQALQLTSLLGTCDDGDETMLCTSAVFPSGGSSLRIAKATGAVSTFPLAAGGDGARELGAGLYDLAGREPEEIAFVDATGARSGPRRRASSSRVARSARIRGGTGDGTATSSSGGWGGWTATVSTPTCPSRASPGWTRPRARSGGWSTVSASGAAAGSTTSASPRDRRRFAAASRAP